MAPFVTEYGANRDVIAQLVYNPQAKFTMKNIQLSLSKLVEHYDDTGKSAPIALPVFMPISSKLAEMKSESAKDAGFRHHAAIKSAPVAPVVKVIGNSCFCVLFCKILKIT